eukprot:EG_transcript_5694
MKWRTCVLSTGFVVFAIVTVCLAIFYFGRALNDRANLAEGKCYILNFDILETSCVGGMSKWTGYSKRFVVDVQPANVQADIFSPAVQNCATLEDAEKDAYWTYDAQETHVCYYQKDTPATVSFEPQALADLTLPILATCVAGGISACFITSLALLWTLKRWRVPKPEKLPPMSDIETAPAPEEPLPHTYNPRPKDRRRPNTNPMEDMKQSTLRARAYVLQEGTGDASGADLLKEESVHTKVINRMKKLATTIEPPSDDDEMPIRRQLPNPHPDGPALSPREPKDTVFLTRSTSEQVQGLATSFRAMTSPRAAPVVPLDGNASSANPRSAARTPHSTAVTPRSRDITPTSHLALPVQFEGPSREPSEALTLDPTSPTVPEPKTPRSILSPLRRLGLSRSTSAAEPLDQQVQSPRSRSSSRAGFTSRGRARVYAVEAGADVVPDAADWRSTARGSATTPRRRQTSESLSREPSEALTLDPTSPTMPEPKTPRSILSPLRRLGLSRSASVAEPLDPPLQSPRSRSSSRAGCTSRGRGRVYAVEACADAASDVADARSTARTPRSTAITPRKLRNGEGPSREPSEALTLDPASPTVSEPKTPRSILSPLRRLGLSRSASAAESLDPPPPSARSRSSSKAAGPSLGRGRVYTVEPCPEDAPEAADGRATPM